MYDVGDLLRKEFCKRGMSLVDARILDIDCLLLRTLRGNVLKDVRINALEESMDSELSLDCIWVPLSLDYR